MTEEEAAYYLLQELKDNRLEVIKHNNKRVVIKENAEWYKKLCASYERPTPRKQRTIIKRCHTMKCLERILNNQDGHTTYYQRIRPFLESRMGENN